MKKVIVYHKICLFAGGGFLRLESKVKEDSVSKETLLKEPKPFTTVSNLLTVLLTDVQKQYITTDAAKDKRMRKRIKKSIEIINSLQEMSNLLIKRNPLKKSSTIRNSDTA